MPQDDLQVEILLEMILALSSLHQAPSATGPGRYFRPGLLFLGLAGCQIHPAASPGIGHKFLMLSAGPLPAPELPSGGDKPPH